MTPLGTFVEMRPSDIKSLFQLDLAMAFACLCGLPSRAADATAVTLSDRTEERTEYERLKQRFLDRRNSDLLNAAGWTLAHGADENEVKKAESILKGLTAFGAQGLFEQLDRRGGVKTFKNEIASLLKSGDPTMRGFAAITLAVFADPNYTKDIAALLERKSSPDKNEDGPLDNFDRSRAAMALGLLGAKEYTAQIAELLKSRDSQERSGAALGLGFMGAKESADGIAKLLQDDDDHVLNAAAQALGELDAKAHIPTIAKLLRHRGDPSVYETAAYVLARLQAKAQAQALAELLTDRFRKGCGAKALAVLGAAQYTGEIAEMLKDQSPLVRCDALIALGIMHAVSQVSNVAGLLEDKQNFVRPYAAVALLLMQDLTQSRKIQALLGSDQVAMSRIDACVRLHPVLNGRSDELVAVAAAELQNLR